MSEPTQRKSREMERFGHYLRYGVVLPEDAEDERKFNPYRADDGRYDFAPGNGTLPPRAHRPAPAGMTAPVHRERAAAGSPKAGAVLRSRRPAPAPTKAPARQDHGALSAKYETGGSGDPGRVSSGTGDRGGISYGIYQFSSKTGGAMAFIRSPEALRWTRDFQGLTPGTSVFDARWRQVATRDGAAFAAAQKSYVDRGHYSRAVQAVVHSTGFDLDSHSEALRQVTYSTAVQHGPSGGPGVIAEAIKRTDRRLARGDRQYEFALINNIYDRRVEIVTAIRDFEKRKGDVRRAQTYDNILKNRYPDERSSALRMLTIR